MPKLNFQRWLDQFSESVLARDFDAYAGLVHMPLHVITRTDTTVVSNVDLLRKGFDSWTKMIRDQRVDHWVCKAREVEMLADGSIVGDFDNELLSNARRVSPPWVSHALLIEVDGIWKVTRISVGITNRGFPISIPRVSE